MLCVMPRMRSTSLWCMPICRRAHLLPAGMLPCTSPSNVLSRDLTVHGLQSIPVLTLPAPVGAAAAPAVDSVTLAEGAGLASALAGAGSQSAGAVALVCLDLLVVFFLLVDSGGQTGLAGAAAGACSAAGAHVTHVDASKKSVAYARENAELSGLSDRPIRWIVEDARKFVAREVRRGSKYDGIILDPPKYGRGANGEVWRLFEDMPDLLKDCAALLSDDASFLLLNAYAARISGLSLAHIMAEATHDRGGRIDWGELALSEDGKDARAIGLSFFARWSA